MLSFIPNVHMGPDGGWGMGPGMMGGYGFFWMLMMLVFWVAVIAGIVFLVKWLAAPRGGAHADEAMETLRRRFASGEISREEFEERRKVLGGR